METYIKKFGTQSYICYNIGSLIYLLDGYPSKNKAKQSKRKIDFLIQQIQTNNDNKRESNKRINSPN
jgi:hypothetical protein